MCFITELQRDGKNVPELIRIMGNVIAKAKYYYTYIAMTDHEVTHHVECDFYLN